MPSDVLTAARHLSPRNRAEWSVFALTLGLLGLLLALVLLQDRASLHEVTRDRLAIQARTLHESIAFQLRAINNLLLNSAEEWERLEGRPDRNALMLTRLKADAHLMPGVRTLGIVDAKGIMQITSLEKLTGRDSSQREYYLHPRETHDPARLYISKPFKSAVDDIWLVSLSRLLLDHEGRFAGVVMASLEPAFFQAQLASANFAPDMWAALAHGSGIQFVMASEREGMAGMAGMDLARPGSLFTRHRDSGRSHSVLDGTVYATGERRILALQTINPPELRMDHPLVIAVGRLTEQVEAPWFRELWLSTSLYGLLLLSGAGWLALLQRRRRAQEAESTRLAAQLDAERVRLLGIVEGTGAATWEWNVQTGAAVFNERWAQMLGYTLAELAPISIDTWTRLTHPDDLDASNTLLQKHFSGESELYQCEARMRHRDGHWVWVLDRGRVITRTADGAPILMYGTHQDITERKHMELELVAREATFRALFENMPDAVVLIDPHTGQPERFNSLACAQLGYSPEEFARLHVADFEAREQPEEIHARMHTLLVGQVLDFETEHRRRDGTSLPIRVLVRKLDIEGRELLLAVFHDLSAIRAAEQAARESLERLRKLAANLPGVLYQYQRWPGGRACFPYASERLEDIYAVTPDEVREDASPFFAVIHPDDLPRVAATIDQSAAELAPWQIAYRVLHPQRGLIWVEGHAMPEPQTDGSLLWHGHIFDISERQRIEAALAESERRFRQFADNVEFVFWIRTAKQMLYINPAFERIWGHKVEELYARPDLFLETTHPDDQDRVRAAVRRSRSEGGFDEKYRILRPDGEIRWIHARNYLVPSADGEPPRYAGVATDITAQIGAEQARQSLTEDLARSNAELEQFAYVASHDLRQPLRMINSYSQLLERRLADRLDDETHQMLGFLSDGAQRMDQMLLSLLEYSRVGRKGAPMAPLDARAALDEALHFLSPQIAETGARIDIQGDWPRVNASRDEFTRLFQNLIGNALKYRVPNIPPHIEIAVEACPEGWCFRITDNGIGIDPEQIDRLFKVFQRLQTRQKYEGYGIGLAICRKIVERHGGHIHAESAGEGQGSCFRFTLPKMPEDVA